MFFGRRSMKGLKKLKRPRCGFNFVKLGQKMRRGIRVDTSTVPRTLYFSMRVCAPRRLCLGEGFKSTRKRKRCYDQRWREEKLFQLSTNQDPMWNPRTPSSYFDWRLQGKGWTWCRQIIHEHIQVNNELILYHYRSFLRFSLNYAKM